MTDQPREPYRMTGGAPTELPPEGEHHWVALVLFRVDDPLAGIVDIGAGSIVGSPILVCARCQAEDIETAGQTCPGDQEVNIQ